MAAAAEQRLCSSTAWERLGIAILTWLLPHVGMIRPRQFWGVRHVQFPVWWFQIPSRRENMSCSCCVRSQAVLSADKPYRKVSFYPLQLFCGSSSHFAESGAEGAHEAVNNPKPGHAVSGHHAERAHPLFALPGLGGRECPFLGVGFVSA